MYKVFINNKRIILANNREKIDYGEAAVVCLKKPEVINSVIRNHVLNSDTRELTILSPDYEGLVRNFESAYEIRPAAGGWVWNEHNELLMILRDGVWDLPKGHLDQGENLEQCALREVTEETGISRLSIVKKIGISRHTYEFNGKHILKESHWYRMHAPRQQQFKPQSIEGIKEVCWVPNNEVEDYLKKSWKSLWEFYGDYRNSILP